MRNNSARSLGGGTAVIAAAVLVGIMNAPRGRAQRADGSTKAHFEVAAVRRSVLQPPTEGGKGPSAPCRRRFTVNGGRVDLGCFPLTHLIATAYEIPILPDLRIAGPDWMKDQLFDISATMPPGASEGQVPEMLQALLADRFKLAVHRESKETSIYALVVGKDGLKMKDAASGADDQAPPGEIATKDGIQYRGARITSPNGNGFTILMTNPDMGTVRESPTTNPDGIRRLEAPNTTLEGLAEILTVVVAPPIPFRDMTGIKGRFQVVLDVSLKDFQAVMAGPHDPADAQNAMLKAGQEAVKKFGLQLEPRKGPVDTIVVDHVEKNPTEN
jgi:uncharacterized protein (TIGR03435 family)